LARTSRLYFDLLAKMPFTEGLRALSLRWTQPIQQHGRLMPSFNSERTRATWSARVSAFFTEMVQQIHSLRAKGVRSFHFANAAASESRNLS
jgi:hypothetical protein